MVTYQVVELDCGDTLVYTRNDLHCDGGGVDMVWVEPVTQPRHAGCDFVELHAFFASIWRASVSHGNSMQQAGGIQRAMQAAGMAYTYLA